MPKKEDKLKGKREATQFKSGEQAVLNGRRGGIASGEAKKKKKTMAQLAKLMLDCKAPDKTIARLKTTYGDMLTEDMTVAATVMAGQINSAMQGNTRAFEALTALTDKAIASEDSEEYKLPAEVIGKDFVDINRHIQPNIKYVFEGGRGSLKSSYIGFKVVELLKNNPELHACVTRQVGNTLKDSVFAQIKWCINKLGLSSEFTIKNSPAEITYKKTGQKIYFRGLDDESKLKSIKPDFGYIGILWKEEKDQMKGADQERSVNQSVLRGGDVTYDFSSYNPPKSKDNWVNKEAQIPDDNRVIHRSNYLNAPAEWLGEKFLQDAAHLKKVNPEAYENEYMGEANGAGGNVFENIEARTITDEEIQTFDNIIQGIDFGWFPDKFAFVRTYYDSDAEKIYFIDEIYVNKTSNHDNAVEIIKRGYDDFIITCDSAEPKSINDLKDEGLSARGAIKGPGSIAYGFKWLQNRTLVIDPERTPNAYKEFTQYEYDRDKEGNVISGYPDGQDDHLIAALRYAYEQHFNRRGTSA